MSKKKSIFMSVVALILGIAIGVGVTLGISSANSNGTAADTTTPAWVSDWGSPVVTNGHTAYINSDDWCSAVIGEDDITWVKAEAAGTSCWFGISNYRSMDGTPIFEVGGRFSVRMIDRNEHSSEWNQIWQKLDKELKAELTSESKEVEIEIAAADGTTLYKDYGTMTGLYVSIPSDAETEPEIIGISDDDCDVLETTVVPGDGVEYPDDGTFLYCVLDHSYTDFVISYNGFLS